MALYGREDAARTLLVFNGIGASVETVAPFVAHFRDTRVITFDVPGVGGSPTPGLPYRLAGWRGWRRACSTAGDRQVDVFGVSWGGALAQQFAHDFPARCRSLTLAATSAGFVMVPGSLRVLKQLRPAPLRRPGAHAVVGADIYGGAAPPRPRPARRARAGDDRHHRARLSLPDAGGLRLDELALAAPPQAPVLILMGGDDPIVPPINGRIIADRLPDARLEMVACGHLFILTDPAGTAARIERFLAGDGDRPASPPLAVASSSATEI